jgi:1-acyl-sn-glycerol-3-phosphate acyltransferase
LARPYVRRRLRRSFDGVYTEGLDAVAELASQGPIIVAANHVCWWDALTIIALDDALETRSHCLMDAQNLAGMPFFGWVGAVPLDRSAPRQALRDMRASTELCTAPGDALWIFPQGEQRPAHLRPLGLHGGVFWLARKAGAAVVPLSLSYLYREAPQPTVLARFGASLSPPAKDESARFMAHLERALVEGLERCDQYVLSGAGAFDALVAPRHGHRVPVAGRLLAAALRPRASQQEQLPASAERSEAHG